MLTTFLTAVTNKSSLGKGWSPSLKVQALKEKAWRQGHVALYASQEG